MKIPALPVFQAVWSWQNLNPLKRLKPGPTPTPMSQPVFMLASRLNLLKKYFLNFLLASGLTVKINRTRYSIISLAIIVGSLSMFTAPTHAETRYVSDVMHIQLRRSPGNQQPVVASGLASGTSLEFVREELDNNRI